MRRVVITGLGIVSSIGNDAEAVTRSLKAGRSGISFAPDYAEHGFRCQVHGQAAHRRGRADRQAPPALHGRRRRLRLYRDAPGYRRRGARGERRLERADRADRRLGRAVDAQHVRGAPDGDREGQPEADGAVHGDALHVLDGLGLPRDAVPDQGDQLFDHLGLLDQRALHRQRRRADPVRQAGHRLRRRRRGARLDALVPLRRDGGDEHQVQQPSRAGEPGLRRRPRRLRDRGRRRHGGARGARARQGARGADLRRGDGLRRDLGRARHGGALGRRRRAGDAARALDAAGGAAGRLHQRARHLDPGGRRQRGRGGQAGFRRGRGAADQLDQVDDRAQPGRRRGAGGDLLPADAEGRLHRAVDQRRDPRPGAPARARSRRRGSTTPGSTR